MSRGMRIGHWTGRYTNWTDLEGDGRPILPLDRTQRPGHLDGGGMGRRLARRRPRALLGRVGHEGVEMLERGRAQDVDRG